MHFILHIFQVLYNFKSRQFPTLVHPIFSLFDPKELHFYKSKLSIRTIITIATPPIRMLDTGVE